MAGNTKIFVTSSYFPIAASKTAWPVTDKSHYFPFLFSSFIFLYLISPLSPFICTAISVKRVMYKFQYIFYVKISSFSFCSLFFFVSVYSHLLTHYYCKTSYYRYIALLRNCAFSYLCSHSSLTVFIQVRYQDFRFYSQSDTESTL
jgi:hypothetical protein